jgi:hypothetical protein
MAYHLLVFDPAAAPRDRCEFLNWEGSQSRSLSFDPAALFNLTGPRSRDEFRKWHREQSHSMGDPTPALRAWLSDMLQMFPAGDPYRAPGGADYRIGPSVIYADFPWQQMEPAYERAFSLAARHRLGLFNAAFWTQEVWFPDEGERLLLLHRAALDPQKVPFWAIRLIPYAERWNISDDGDRSLAVDALNDTALEDLANCLDETPDFWEWLASESERLGAEYARSQEHLAMTVMGMAVDNARVALARRWGTLPEPPPRRPLTRLLRWRSWIGPLIARLTQALEFFRSTKGQGYATDLPGPPVWVWRWVLLVMTVAMILRVVAKFLGG